MSRKENTKTKTPLRTIQFLNYEGLQIKYGTSDELIIVPLNITNSKVGDEGETDYKAFWKIENGTFEIPPYKILPKNAAKNTMKT